MKILKLQLENFRSYKNHSHEFDVDNRCTIIVGENGKGKTNLLEAIYLLSLGKSFRSNFPDDLVNWDEDYLRCNCEITEDEEKSSLEVFYSCKPTRRKNFKINDVNLKNSEYIGNLITVLFHPEDLNMLYLSPALRRRYADILLSQTDKGYLFALSKYSKTLKHRNALLEQIRKLRFKGQNTDRFIENLNTWDEQITEFGSEIIKSRIELIKFLQNRLEKIYNNISGKKESLYIKYKSQIVKNDHFLGKGEKENILEAYKKNLASSREKDILKAITTTGPHRDDFIFGIDERQIAKAASRGEFRTLLLAIKLAEIEFIKEKTSKNPILLLDDVFSELDRGRQLHLLEAIKDCQIIITTTEINKIIKEGKEEVSIVTM